MDQTKSPKFGQPSLSSVKGSTSIAPSPTPPPTTERRAKPKNKPGSLEPVLESDSKVLRSPRETHPDNGLESAKVQSSKEVSRRRGQYFHEALHERNANPAADLVRGEAMILAEVRTNVKIKNEYQFITNLSEHLASRYNRKVGSIIVILEHSKCMLFGGSAHMAYTLTISALPSEVRTATNKRNTVVIQKYMEAALQVPSTRGLIQFIPVGEECLGWGGKTVAGQIAEITGRTTPDTDEIKTQERRLLKSLSLRRFAPANVTPPSTQSPTPSNGVERARNLTPTPTSEALMNGGQDAKKVVRKKSIIHTLFRSSKDDGEALSGHRNERG